ncbi:hypothetical protein AtubIFM56815_005133 [Aspergillus tubingensis]|uniref:Xylanolytic transcriptional activator regulatory domain-containing protein n=1 Tax=Aspergillus tubingensis TaxID=5068 RepID=A0A9W6EJK9_ASPTU|nr:hypothetical protein AtubIFM56815_005133 [Aspergillus tubingensis]
MTACARCQKRKIRYFSYVDELEARIEWLESIIREHLPYIDLHKPDEPEGSVPLDRRRGSVCRGSNPSTALETHTSQNGNDKDDWGPARDITDQLGLVSINAEADLRYLGPSSGLFFTRFVLTGLGRRAGLAQESVPPTGGTNFIPAELLDIQPKGLPSELKQAQWLTQAYFQAVHGQFPFLHRPSHLDLLQKAYNGIELLPPIDQFQIYMVLAIGATIRSQQVKILLSAEGYCASAIVHLDTIFQKSSVRGVQCMLLLQMYTFHNPSSTISLWTLHYHCLAHVLELGLHRNVRGSAFTEFDQEMRTRVFCPLFPYPSKTLIKLCFDSALECTRLYRHLYITKEEETTLETVLPALKSASDILSATGEYWLEVKRTRDVLDCITRATMRRFSRRLGQTSTSLPSGRSGTLHNNINSQGVSIMDLPTTTLNDGSCTDGITGNGNAGPVSVDPYYVPAQQPDATPELLSFFMDPQPESAMELLDFSWDVFGGVDDAMQEIMAGASGE